ncbi:MAG: SIS domain-containing protein [bacterium]
MKNTILRIINENRKTMLDLAGEADKISKLGKIACAAYRKGGKLVFFGNGGSASDAQHLATEMVCRFKKNRKSLPALALTVNTSLLTATANDFSFDRIFSRQVESLVTPKDVVIGISTSGSSPNVLSGIKEARKIGAYTAGLTGSKDTKLHKRTNLCIRIPSTDTARIQEGHILVGHILCELIEDALF